MINKIEANGHINDGKLTIHYRAMFEEMLLKMPNCAVSLVVERKRKRRSLPQNAYYHAVVVQMVYHGLIDVGYELQSIEEAHEVIKEMFFKQDLVNTKTGEVLIIKTTTKESTFTFMEKLELIRAWAKEYLNIYIPEPNEQTKIEL